MEHIIHCELKMRKLCGQCVIRDLNEEQKQLRKSLSQQNMDLCFAYPNNFCARLITQDEIWVHQYDMEAKEQMRQWKYVDFPPLTIFKVQKCAKKVTTSVFWDAESIIFIHYLS